MHKRLPGEHIQRHQRHAQRPDEFDTSPKAGLDAIIFAGPEVLRRIVGNAVAERGQRRDDHVVELHRRRVACHDGRAEAVDDALDDDIADGDKALLQNARDSDDRKPAKMVPRKDFDFPFGRELYEAADVDGCTGWKKFWIGFRT